MTYIQLWYTVEPLYNGHFNAKNFCLYTLCNTVFLFRGENVLSWTCGEKIPPNWTVYWMTFNLVEYSTEWFLS